MIAATPFLLFGGLLAVYLVFLVFILVLSGAVLLIAFGLIRVITLWDKWVG